MAHAVSSLRTSRGDVNRSGSSPVHTSMTDRGRSDRAGRDTDGGPTLVVLAAGVGRRYGGLKQLEPVGPGGEVLLEYSIFDAIRAGLDRVVLVIRPETEDEFRSMLESRIPQTIELRYAYQEIGHEPAGSTRRVRRTKPWGTGHAILAAEAEVPGAFIVINADDFYGRSAFSALASFLTARDNGPMPTYALAGFEVGPTRSVAGPVSRGLCKATSDGWLEKIVEVLELEKHGAGGVYTDSSGVERLVDAGELVSMNMWGFTPEVFRELHVRFGDFVADLGPEAEDTREFMIPDAVQGMIADRVARVRVLRHQGRWCGITFPEDGPRVTSFIADQVQRGEYPSPLW
jgi:NDP-sugar pyrophosphorylase family protein